MSNYGRNEIPIDWNIVDGLLEAGCKGTEIAARLGIHHETLYNRTVSDRGVTFTTYAAKMREKGEAILREVQYLKAIGKSDKGDNNMLIWLGKNRLKQMDKQPEERATETLGALHKIIAKLAGDVEPSVEQQTEIEHKE